MAKNPDPTDDQDNPELTEADFARDCPFMQAHPEFAAPWNKGGRPRVETPKIHLGLRLAADVVNGIKSTGRGYNARVEKVLRDALAKGLL
jgi:uncharacterized protein (DUF4415 family)